MINPILIETAALSATVLGVALWMLSEKYKQHALLRQHDRIEKAMDYMDCQYNVMKKLLSEMNTLSEDIEGINKQIEIINQQIIQYEKESKKTGGSVAKKTDCIASKGNS